MELGKGEQDRDEGEFLTDCVSVPKVGTTFARSEKPGVVPQ